MHWEEHPVLFLSWLFPVQQAVLGCASTASTVGSTLCLATLLHLWAVVALLPLVLSLWSSHGSFPEAKKGAGWSSLGINQPPFPLLHSLLN